MKYKSLTTQISIVIILITTVLLSMFGYYRYMFIQKRLMHQLNDKADRITKRLTINLSLPLYNFDNKVVINTINSEMDDQEIEGILLYGKEKDKPEYAYIREKNGPPSSPETVLDTSNYITRNAGILFNEEELGKIHVYMTTKYIRDRLGKSLFSDILQIVVLDILLSAFVVILLRINFIRPILILTKASSTIAAGNLEQKIDTGGKDEIGVLARSFAHMRDSVREKISDLARKNQALQESEERFRQLSEATWEAIAIHDHGILLQANMQFFEMFGYDQDSMLGQNGIERVVSPESLEYAKTQVVSGKIDPYEAIGLRKDGTKFPIEIRVKMMEYHGKTVRVAAIRDITERKLAEEEIKKHQDHLEERVKERTKELEATQKELIISERLAILGRLIATVSHELLNPLGVIRSSIFYINRKLRSEDQKTVKHIHRIDDQINQCDSIIKDLMEYSKGRRSVILPREINSFLEDILKNTNADSDNNISLAGKILPGLPLALLDEEKLQLAIQNIVKNAFEAVKEKKERLNEQDTPYQPVVELRALRVENGIKLEIEDNGIGMDPEIMHHACDPLFTTRIQGVTGLGLAIAKKVIEEHDGTITIESKQDIGTKVFFVIPVK